MGAAVGTALLLYTGQGLLATAGFLVAVLLIALAAGLWVGAIDQVVPGRIANVMRGRWLWVVLAYSVAGVFAALWGARASLRALALGGALAVLLIVAEPAYAAGGLIAGLHARRNSATASTATSVIAGAAFGILLATTLLIPLWDAPFLFLAAAVVLAAAGVIETAAGTIARPAKATTMNTKVILVTGVGDPGQVGFAIARHLLQHNARVAITSRGPRVTALADELRQFGAVHAVSADLTSPDDAARVVAATLEHFGRLDGLIHTAGGLTVTKSILETTPDEWRQELQRNAETALVIDRAALLALRESRGSIVHFASPAALHPKGRLGAYSAAKAALVALTRSLALEEKHNGVRVNAIAPGMIDTEQNRRGVTDPDSIRWVTREQVAAVAYFLVSEDAAAISGEVVQVLGEQL
jgi:NAD(P)-dependent dehydrogenase (short-subunit alcohol dehydrogenase family)